MECISVGVHIHMYKRAKTPVKATSDFYNSLPTRMQTMKNLKGFTNEVTKGFFFFLPD